MERVLVVTFIWAAAIVLMAAGVAGVLFGPHLMTDTPDPPVSPDVAWKLSLVVVAAGLALFVCGCLVAWKQMTNVLGQAQAIKALALAERLERFRWDAERALHDARAQQRRSTDPSSKGDPMEVTANMLNRYEAELRPEVVATQEALYRWLGIEDAQQPYWSRVAQSPASIEEVAKLHTFMHGLAEAARTLPRGEIRRRASKRRTRE